MFSFWNVWSRTNIVVAADVTNADRLLAARCCLAVFAIVILIDLVAKVVPCVWCSRVFESYSEASFSNPTISFIPYQDAKPNGGRSVTRTRRGDSYMDDPRSVLESIHFLFIKRRSSSIDAELPFSLRSQ